MKDFSFSNLVNFADIVTCTKQYLSCNGLYAQCTGKRNMLQTLQREKYKKWSGKPCLFSFKCVLIAANTSAFHAHIL